MTSYFFVICMIIWKFYQMQSGGRSHVQSAP